MAQTVGILSCIGYTRNKTALDNWSPVGSQVGVGPWETCQWLGCAWDLTPWEAVRYGMFRPAHLRPSLRQGSESKMGGP